jgi:ParB/RepB/Spo0J family partition protein
MNIRAGVFAAWRAAWRYGGYWTASGVIGNGGGGGGVSVVVSQFLVPTLPEHVFASGIELRASLECPGPQTEEGAGGWNHVVLPPFPFFEVGQRRRSVTLDGGSVRPVALSALGQKYRRYRLADPPAEEAMAGSLRRWGQLSPVVACVHGGQLEVVDGFKRLAAAQQVGWTTLSVRVIDVDERTAKAALLGLNRDQRPVRELEEAWIVQALVRDDGLTQVEAAHLLGQHKSWVCRRLALLERLSVAVKEDLRLGLVGPSLARQLTRLPAGNQEAVLALVRRETLTAQEVSGVIELLQGASPEQAAFVLAKPREALAQVQGVPVALRDPRLSRAGNWLARHLSQALEALVRVETWLRTPNERELRGPDREIVRPLLARVGDQASVVAELVLGPDLKREKGS